MASRTYECKRCGHIWRNRARSDRRARILPRACPKCHSMYWDEPRKLIYNWQEVHKKVIKV